MLSPCQTLTRVAGSAPGTQQSTALGINAMVHERREGPAGTEIKGKMRAYLALARTVSFLHNGYVTNSSYPPKKHTKKPRPLGKHCLFWFREIQTRDIYPLIR